LKQAAASSDQKISCHFLQTTAGLHQRKRQTL